ncbi:MAG: PIN domain-containing protein, partial [Bdellovibrio sp.]
MAKEQVGEKAVKGNGRRRKIVIDTNVILFDALALTKFHEADVHIPITVIEEVDKFKRDQGENGRNARQFSRFVDLLREKGSLSEGVPLDHHDTVVHINADFHVAGVPEFDTNKADNRILSTALFLQKQYPKARVELITKDINLRIKADVAGVFAKDYEPDPKSMDELYEGYTEISVSSSVIDSFYREKRWVPDVKLIANQYVILKDVQQPTHSAVGRYSEKEKAIVPLINLTNGVWGIQARNVEQAFAMDCLLNDEIMMVSLVGKAGTGKTMLAIAAGLHKTLEEGRYQRLLVSRPIFPMGRDIGYLPG